MVHKKWGISVFLSIFIFTFLTTWLTVSIFSVKERKYGLDRVIDGDTVVLDSGEKIRLLGIDAPDKGTENSDKASVILESILKDSIVWLEGDRYENDLYGRRLGWLWVGCESEPRFRPDDYMKKHRGGENLGDNPVGCESGVLVNEQMIIMGVVELYFVEGEGELKYEERLRLINNN